MSEKYTENFPTEEKVFLDSDNKKENPYLIPLSILGAGLLIAAAILVKDQVPTDSGSMIQNNNSDIASILKIKSSDLSSCVAKKEFDQKIQDDMADAANAGGQGTPYSVVIAPNGKHFVIPGAYPYEEVSNVIRQALAENKNPPSEKEKQDPIYKVKPVSKDDHIQGDPNAPVKIITFSDFQCPFCLTFYNTMQQAMTEYGSKKQIAWIYRHLPLISIHQQAMPWARESECVNKIGGSEKFWQYVEARFQRQNG